ncbi:MAG: RIP metalloprotease RseP [candidate division Zixibacteria bacterium]|nr:RIP metalloprotease RseP [candidate division Zixibacteria bacterium]
MLTAVSFIFVLGVLIFIHELGHFLVAKKVGIRVEKFSLGFPPNIFSIKKGDTTYCIGIIPLGGYVKMAGENPDEEATGDPDEFMSKSILQRAAVIFAGPFMNYILAIAIFIGFFLFVGEPQTDPDRVMVGEVVDEGAAMAAGIQTGDQILSINDTPVKTFEDVTELVYPVIEGPLAVAWLHGGDTLRSVLTTALSERPNAMGGIDSVGVIGFSEQIVSYRSYGVIEATTGGFMMANTIFYETLKFLKRLVFREVSFKMLGGPIFIAQQSGKEARKGIPHLFSFMALLSINLALLNVLPIPVLDGGHLVFLLIEKLRGNPLSMKARMTALQVGFVVLIVLIVAVSYNDILRFIGNL